MKNPSSGFFGGSLDVLCTLVEGGILNGDDIKMFQFFVDWNKDNHLIMILITLHYLFFLSGFLVFSIYDFFFRNEGYASLFG